MDELGVDHPRPAIMVIGSAKSLDEDNAFENRIERLFKFALAPICAEAGAAVVYGGTSSGVMRVLGGVLAEFAPEVPLVGVAPLGLVSFDGEPPPPGGAEADSNHTHFVLAPPGAWSSEGSTLVGVAERIANDRNLVVVVVGGGKGTLNEVSLACQREWPVLVVSNVGGTAADIAESIAESVNWKEPPHTDSPEIKDVNGSIFQGRVTACQVSDLHGLRRALRWQFSDDALLKEAWLRLGIVDKSASHEKPRFLRLKKLLLALGLLTTLISVGIESLPKSLHTPARVALLATASVSGGVVAFIARRRRDSRWVSLRAATQAIAREIYRFRTHAGVYWKAYEQENDRLLFAASLAAVDDRLSGETALAARPKGFANWPPRFGLSEIDTRDDLLTPLNASMYDEVRVEDQIAYFTRTVGSYNSRIDCLLIRIFLASVIATALGAMSFTEPGIESWVALAVAVGAAFVSWLDSEQLEQQTVQMSFAAAGVRAARERWLAEIDEGIRNEPRAVSAFAEEVEEVLEAESTQWERVLRQAHRSFRASASHDH